MILAADTLETLQAPFNTKKWTSTLVKPTIQTFSTKFNKDQAVVNYEKNKKKAVTISEFRRQHSNVTKNFDVSKFLTTMFEKEGDYTFQYIIDRKFPGRKPGISKIKSVLKEIAEITGVIPGVTTTHCYVGTERSVAPFHTEDANLLSLNIMVEGEPKEWWFIPSSNSKKFEEFSIRRNHEAEVGCPNVPSHKNIFPNPSELAKNNIDYYTFQQKPGDAVITAPNAYHGIINTGLNTNVAINFANLFWEEKFHFTKLSCTCRQNHSIATDLIDNIHVAKHLGKVEKFVEKQNMYMPNPEKRAELFKKVCKENNPKEVEKKQQKATKRQSVQEKFLTKGEKGQPIAANIDPPLQPLPSQPTLLPPDLQLPTTAAAAAATTDTDTAAISNSTAHQNDQKNQAKLSKVEWKNWYETLGEQNTKQPSKMPTRCKKCKNVFCDRYTYARHFKIKHSIEGKAIPTPKNFICFECGKKYCAERSLVWHQQKVHQQSAVKIGCEHCEGFFFNKSNLKKHVKIFHT